ncbi:acyl-homoserine-lactone synthase [Sphingobium sp. BS19]|uniref:acyl-homoserine-lactone synthase n=1 Tax=Sphingobium sp. BS19 TaxID=3018973 RepID=UPI0022ED8010|nr:acyl-homoserine-lactone synthase [Sphingobium sp. BS19]GLI99081.1 hypothetical protein Sbs19_28990 [Sphingobium sp. BS19]
MSGQTAKPHDVDEDMALRAMFQARKEVFIDLLKWELPVLAGRFEVDQFDTVDAEYLVLIDAGRHHRASARLLRTDRPHILADLYPHLCAGPVPRGSHVREVTRFCLDRHQRAADRRLARNQLITALVDHALANGIAAFTGVAEQKWFEQIRYFGWACEALGQPVGHGPRWLTALHIVIDDQTINGLRKAGIHAAEHFTLHAPRRNPA